MSTANFGNIVGRDVWFSKVIDGDKDKYGTIIAADVGDRGIRVYVEDIVLGSIWQRELYLVKFNKDLETDEEYP